MGKIKLEKAVVYSRKRAGLEGLDIESFITTDNLLANKIGVRKATGLPPNGDSFPAYFDNDILVSNIRPYLKKIWFANTNGVCSSDVLNFETKKDFSAKFIYYNLYQDAFFEHMMKGAKGTKMPRGDKNQILEFEIPNFSYEIQQKIANILTDIDNKIDLNNRINDNLERMAKTLYEYWFVQFDFPDDKGKPYKSSGGEMVYNDILKRDIPVDWEVHHLEKCIDKIIDYRGRTPKKLYSEWSEKITDIIAISAKHIKNGKLVNLENANRVDEILYSKWMKEKLVEGDVLMTSEAPCGEFFYLIGDVKYCLSQRVFAIRANSQYINHSCLYFELSFGNGYSQIMGKVSGSTVFGIRQDELRTVNVLIPNKELQETFSKEINSIYKRIRNNEKQNQHLSLLRDWLLPMLMNGQVKVE